MITLFHFVMNNYAVPRIVKDSDGQLDKAPPHMKDISVNDDFASENIHWLWR